MEKPKIVSPAAWIEARKAFLVKEKEFTKVRDALSKVRQALPWERVEKDYVFDGPNGKETLSDLFEERHQLIVYHFMFGPDWDEGCPSCSYLADHFNPAIPHLNQRDVTMIAVSRAPLEKLEAFKKRMGWTFKWVSSMGNDFNQDYNVSFTEDELEQSKTTYNYKKQTFPSTEAPGVSVFCKGENGDVLHAYSSFGRGLDMFIISCPWDAMRKASITQWRGFGSTTNTASSREAWPKPTRGPVSRNIAGGSLRPARRSKRA